jgi:hypothetical protein
MAIERVINGVVYEFPDGTPAAVINRFQAQKMGESTGAAFVPPSQGRKAPTPMAAPPDRPRPLLPNAAGAGLQGLSFGFSDEAIARMRSSMDPRSGRKNLSNLVTDEPAPGSYESYLKAEREGLRKYGEENPIASTTAELAGGIAPALVTGGAAAVPAVARAVGPKVAGLMSGATPSIRRMMGYGAGSGAASAVGTSEKSLAELPGEAVRGATTGALLTGTLGAAGKYVASPLYQRLKRSLGFGDSNKMADLAITKALEKDGLSVEDAVNAINAMSRGQGTLADLGENTAALLRRATSAPGAARNLAKDTLVNREMGRIPRVSEDLRTLMSGSRDFYTDVTDLIKKRSDDAKALYDSAWASSPTFNPQTAPDIARLQNLPSFQAAMKGGARRMADQGLDITDPKNTLRGLHETKMELDDMIEKALTSDRTANQARILMGIKERLLKDMEKASPEYQAARLEFAGDSEMLAALKEGQRIYQLPEPEMRKLIQRFSGSPSEYDAFRAGISQAMLEKLRTSGASSDPFRTVLGKDSEDKIRRAFRDDGAFEEFKKRLIEEAQMLRTEKAGFRKTPVDTDLDAGASAVGAATRLATGSPIGAATEAVQAMAPRMAGYSPSVAQPTVEKLTTPGSGLQPVIDSIMASLKQQEQMLVKASTAGNVGAAATGAAGARRGIPEQYPEDTGGEPQPQGGQGGLPQGLPNAPQPAPVSQ